MRFFPRWRDWPWAAKLAVLLMAMAVMPVLVLTLYGEAALRRDVVAAADASNLQRARNTASLIDGYLENLTADVTVLALAPPTASVLRDGPAGGETGDLQVLLRVLQRTKKLDELLVIDYAGAVIAATSAELVGRSEMAAPFFLSAIAGEAGAQDPRFVAERNRVLIHVAVPVLTPEARLLGVVAARVGLEEVDRLVQSDTNYSGRDEYGLLWDERGLVLSGPAAPIRRFAPLGTLPRHLWARLVAEQRFGPATEELVTAAGRSPMLVEHARWRMYDDSRAPVALADLGAGRVRVSSVPMSGRRWTYGVVVPEERVLASIHDSSRRNIGVVLATSFLALGLAVVAARRLSRPLQEVGDAARALASGDMSRRVRLDRGDEVGELGAAFDAMAESLAAQDAELRRHAETLEQRVASRTAELAGLLSAIPDMLFKLSRDGRILDYVAAKESHLAVPPEQFLRRPLRDVLPADVAELAYAALHRVLDTGAAPPFEYRLVVAGEERQFEARASAVGPDTAVFLIRDFTERHRQEERVRFLTGAGGAFAATLDFESIVEALARLPVPFLADACIVDLLEHGSVRFAAAAARTPELEALVMLARRRFPVRAESDHPVAVALRGAPLVVPRVGDALLERVAQSPEHARIMAMIAPVSMIVLPLTGRERTIGALSLISTSDTRIYEDDDLPVAEEFARRGSVALENARLYRDLQESNRLKDEFLGIVSHELRTPLNAVLGWTQVLRRAPGDPQQFQRALEAIERNARAQATLVEDLLDTSRVISGKLRVELKPVDLAALVESAVESFRPAARDRGLELFLFVSPGVGIVPADASRLQQVVGNLVSNALKFTPAGGHVDVSVAREDSHVTIEVRDTGVGIRPDFLPFVFDRFTQADSTTTRAHGGLGIGLAIVRHIVELHGGTILAESDGESRGSRFIVQLPAWGAEAAAVSS